MASIIYNLWNEVMKIIWTPSTTTGSTAWTDASNVPVVRAPVVTPPPTVSQRPPAVPVNTVLPVITGVAQDGQVLSVTSGTWNNSPTFTYQWSNNGAAISGANGVTYTLQTSDVGASITCTITAENAGGSATATSLPVGPVIPRVPVNSLAPVISGTATQGQTLTVTNNGTWTANPTTYTYQWKRNGSAITGQTSSSYVLTAADVGSTILCTVWATNAGGSGQCDSNSIGPIAASAVTPSVTRVSAAGATPVILSLTDGDYVAGKYLQWEFANTLAPAKNADGTYNPASQGGVAFIDGDSWARLDLALGYTQPVTAFAFHCRILTEDEAGATSVTDQLGNTFNADAGAWSNDYTDTIGSAQASFSPSATQPATSSTSGTSHTFTAIDFASGYGVVYVECLSGADTCTNLTIGGNACTKRVTQSTPNEQSIWVTNSTLAAGNYDVAITTSGANTNWGILSGTLTGSSTPAPTSTASKSNASSGSPATTSAALTIPTGGVGVAFCKFSGSSQNVTTGTLVATGLGGLGMISRNLTAGSWTPGFSANGASYSAILAATWSQ